MELIIKVEGTNFGLGEVGEKCLKGNHMVNEREVHN